MLTHSRTHIYRAQEKEGECKCMEISKRGHTQRTAWRTKSLRRKSEAGEIIFFFFSVLHKNTNVIKKKKSVSHLQHEEMCLFI